MEYSTPIYRFITYTFYDIKFNITDNFNLKVEQNGFQDVKRFTLQCTFWIYQNKISIKSKIQNKSVYIIKIFVYNKKKTNVNDGNCNRILDLKRYQTILAGDYVFWCVSYCAFGCPPGHVASSTKNKRSFRFIRRGRD